MRQDANLPPGCDERDIANGYNELSQDELVKLTDFNCQYRDLLGEKAFQEISNHMTCRIANTQQNHKKGKTQMSEQIEKLKQLIADVEDGKIEISCLDENYICAVSDNKRILVTYHNLPPKPVLLDLPEGSKLQFGSVFVPGIYQDNQRLQFYKIKPYYDILTLPDSEITPTSPSDFALIATNTSDLKPGDLFLLNASEPDYYLCLSRDDDDQLTHVNWAFDTNLGFSVPNFDSCVNKDDTCFKVVSRKDYNNG